MFLNLVKSIQAVLIKYIHMLNESEQFDSENVETLIGLYFVT